MPILLALWWLGATPTAVTVPVVLPAGEAAEDWRHALSLCTAYRLTPSAAVPVAGPMMRIQSNPAGWKVTVRSESGVETTLDVGRADSSRPHDSVINQACSHLWPNDASDKIPLPAPEVTKVVNPVVPKEKGPRLKPRVGAGVKPPTPPTPPSSTPTPLWVSEARALAPGEQLDGLMPVGAAGVCTCSWITDDSDLRSDDARWSFAPSCDTCEPTPPLEVREEVVDRRSSGRR